MSRKYPNKRPISWRSQALAIAAATNRRTLAYLTPDGIVRFTVEGWPLSGQFLGAVGPEETK